MDGEWKSKGGVLKNLLTPWNPTWRIIYLFSLAEPLRKTVLQIKVQNFIIDEVPSRVERLIWEANICKGIKSAKIN